MSIDPFYKRHIGINDAEASEMLKEIGANSIEELMHQVYPEDIFLKKELELPEAMTERELLEHMTELASRNTPYTSYLGQGFYDCVTPAPILRNVLENPVWYTSYTPYQAEVSQGRLEALFNFQTVVTELTGLHLANCSLLDEATAGAEAAMLLFNVRSRAQKKAGVNKLFVDQRVFASTIAVIETRVPAQGMELVIGDYKEIELGDNEYFGAIIQYPDSVGSVESYEAFVKKCHDKEVRVAAATDLLSLTLITPPGEWGADIAFGSAQRLGTPMYYGGPSAGFLACLKDFKREIPGRIVGLSKDAYGRTGYRLALQTREQHIKREKATSNICTAQALLAVMSGFYAVYHGAEGLKAISRRVHSYAGLLAKELEKLGYKQYNANFFDTLVVGLPEGVSEKKLKEIALDCKVNLRYFGCESCIGISIDETTLIEDLNVLLYIFAEAIGKPQPTLSEAPIDKIFIEDKYLRKSNFLQHEVFKKYHTETELMRYIKRLDRKDISLAHSMISLGSCTMKLNAAAELFALSNPHFANIHPYAPDDQAEGYQELISNLESYLAEITGMEATSLQANSGAAGEYTGLRTIRTYLESIGESARDVVILPASAHGTNPASTTQCGYLPIVVKTDEKGNVDWEDFMQVTEEYKDRIAAIMITYPSTHGIFEDNIVALCKRIHECGGQVYMDGANMNAQVGYTNPGFIGADVCHLNLHKTFASPHGGGGPGVGPICVKKHLVPFLPKHIVRYGNGLNQVSSAPYGSAGIFSITYAYIRLLGNEGLKRATASAILNANYLAKHFEKNYGIVYEGSRGRVGHELILECRNLKAETGCDENDVAKRLMDFGYHAPTLSFPVHGTLMIEPTESESKEELDRFCQVMDCIYQEAQEVANGTADKEDNVLKNAPHPQYEVCADEWHHSYPRSKAAFALPYLQDNKFWVNVARLDNGYGDRNLIASQCECDLFFEELKKEQLEQ